MKWTFSIKNKVMASAALFVLCVLVLLSNYLDRIHTENVKNSITTLYEDRLIAEDYIFKMTGIIYQIREAGLCDSNRLAHSDTIRNLIGELNRNHEAYRLTKLTSTEKILADELNVFLKQLETVILNDTKDPEPYSDKALFSLKLLAAVQLDESKLIMQKAESEYASIKASSQFAFAITVLILIVLQAIAISAKPLEVNVPPKNSNLN